MSSEFAPRSSKKWSSTETRSDPQRGGEQLGEHGLGRAGRRDELAGRPARRALGGGSAFRSALSLGVIGMTGSCSR